MTLKKEVYVEKRGYEGKNRAEVEIREKMFRGGAGPRGMQNHSFYGSTKSFERGAIEYLYSTVVRYWLPRHTLLC